MIKLACSSDRTMGLQAQLQQLAYHDGRAEEVAPQGRVGVGGKDAPWQRRRRKWRWGDHCSGCAAASDDAGAPLLPGGWRCYEALYPLLLVGAVVGVVADASIYTSMQGLARKPRTPCFCRGGFKLGWRRLRWGSGLVAWGMLRHSTWSAISCGQRRGARCRGWRFH